MITKCASDVHLFCSADEFSNNYTELESTYVQKFFGNLYFRSSKKCMFSRSKL